MHKGAEIIIRMCVLLRQTSEIGLQKEEGHAFFRKRELLLTVPLYSEIYYVIFMKEIEEIFYLRAQ